VTLQKYREKRRFSATPEPRGKQVRPEGRLRFVVQKHDASRLHYDFRLELDGVMKSWAVPKGPSLNPDDKRLAVMVEDHPLDYRTFEGRIPAGNYGAGTVIVWDEGTYHSADEETARAEQEALRDGLERGHLSFVLEGSKLKGGFSLLKLRRGKQNEWLLIKKRDEFASDQDVLQEERSVRSGRDLREVGESPKATWGKKGETSTNHRTKKSPANGSAKSTHFIKPMLATLVDEPFDREDWLFEIKWDGYRAIAEVDHAQVKLYSRNGISFAERFEPVFKALAKLKHKAVIDGEIVVVDEQGRSRFQLLQNYQKTGKGNLRYFVFDLLELDGKNLRKLPLSERRAKLRKLLGKGTGVVQFSEDIETHGKAFFEVATVKGLEGIVAKKASSTYKDGHRGPEWLKIKAHGRQEAVIGGFTEPRGSRKDLGALVLGVYDGDELVYIGHGGGGIGVKGLADLRERLEALEQKSCPFRDKPKTNAPVHWVTPKLVCEVSFQEWTDDGRMRVPIYLGLREDKDPKMVRREIEHSAQAEERNADKSETAAPGSKRKAAEEPALTHLDKIYWPKEGFTKGDMVAYYREMAPIMMPYLRDRPESLNRHPNGITGKNFFQKDVSKQPPPHWVETATISGGTGDLQYIVCQDEGTLLYLANLGCIEINPWNSRVGHLDNPDYLILDLDPEDIEFAEVVKAAQAVHKVLEKADIPCCCKTSGKRGLHIFVPLGARYDYDAARSFAQILATLVHNQLPETTSLLRSPSQRQHRVYLDYLQNSRGQTLAAPYSIRPAPGATVSAPLAWNEVRKGLDPAKFTIKSMPRRVAKVGDLWTPVLGKGIDLESCLSRLGAS
jgi:bifunctional non-homologous end joining protein LigD